MGSNAEREQEQSSFQLEKQNLLPETPVFPTVGIFIHSNGAQLHLPPDPSMSHSANAPLVESGTPLWSPRRVGGHGM